MLYLISLGVWWNRDKIRSYFCVLKFHSRTSLVDETILLAWAKPMRLFFRENAIFITRRLSQQMSETVFLRTKQ